MKRLIVLFALAACLPLMAQEYKIAVIGLVHSHVWGHLNTMLRNESAKLVGIAEPNQELMAEAKKDAEKAGNTEVRFYDDYKKMLDETKPDIVWAFVENNRHLEIAQVCAPRKIHLMFEKPLAANYKEAVAIRDLAHKYGIQVMTNYQMAWWPANYAAKAQADAGAVGEVWRLHGIVGHGGPGSEGVRNKYFFAWLTDPMQNGAGALMDFGCYNALWSLWYFGRPQTVFAEVNHLRPDRFPKVEDNAAIVLHYPKGVSILEGSWDLPRSYQDLEVMGREGTIYMTQRAVEVRKGRGQAQQVAIEALPKERAKPVDYMIDHIKSGKPLEGMVAMDINVQVIEIIDAAKESVRTGKEVKFPQAAR